MKNNKGFSLVLLLVLAALVIVAIFLLGNMYIKNKAFLDGTGGVVSDTPLLDPKIEVKDIDENSVVGKFEDTEIPDQKKYTSEALGVSFLYLENQGIENIVIEEEGSRIYIYGAAYERDSGQFVEVFSKDPNETLLTALEKQFLKDYPKTDCEAYIKENDSSHPESFEVGSIRVTGGWKDMDDLIARYGACPAVYTESNGISYFVADTNHPDKFVFFSIGQYGIAADPDGADRRMWQETIEFLD